MKKLILLLLLIPFLASAQSGSIIEPKTNAQTVDGYPIDSLLNVPATSSTGLEKLTESTTGWRLIGRNPANYGNIGSEAIDFSYSGFSSTSIGARGQYSFAVGNKATASGTGSFAAGYQSNAGSTYAFALGENATALGAYSYSLGKSCVSVGQSSFTIGAYTYTMGTYSFAGGYGLSGINVKATGESAFNFQKVTGTTKDAIGAQSAILGGLNNSTSSGATKSVVLGGENIQAAVANTVYVPNLMITESSLEFLNTGNSVFIGTGAGENDDASTNQNVFIGNLAGNDNTTGNNNIFFGEKAGEYTTVGYHNFAAGKEALSSNLVGDYNIAIGYTALEDNTGDFNVGLGYNSLKANKTGDYNICLGWESGSRYTGGSAMTTVNNSIFIGKLTYAQSNSQTNQIVIGNEAIGNGSNTATIGDDNITDVYISEDATATAHLGKLHLSSLNTAPSSATDTGTLGEIRITATAIYVCIATDTWVKSDLATW